MHIRQLRASLKKGLRPGYLIEGPERYLHLDALRAIRSAMGDADVSRFHAVETDIRAVVDELRTPGMFADRRLVVLEGLDELYGPRRSSKAADETLLVIAEHLRRPSAGTVLVMDVESLDRRRKAVSELVTTVVVVECPRMKGRALERWCLERARSLGKVLSPAAVRALIGMVGEDMGRLEMHISALACYAGEEGRITQRHVTDLVGGDHEVDVWAIVDAVRERSPRDALRALARLRSQPRYSPVSVIASLARAMRGIMMYKEMRKEGLSVGEIASVLGRSDWVVRKAAAAAERFSSAEMTKRYRMILEADVASKTGVAREPWLLDSLVVRLCEGTV